MSSGEKIDRLVDKICFGFWVAVVLLGLFYSVTGIWSSASDAAARAEKAREEGRRIYEEKVAAAGGEESYVHRLVNQWCRESGKEDAYPGEGSLDKDENPID